MILRNPRDDKGWRIPRPGTLARRVYDAHCLGMRVRDIAAHIRRSENWVSVTIWRFTHPEEDLRLGLIYQKRRKERDRARDKEQNGG